MKLSKTTSFGLHSLSLNQVYIFGFDIFLEKEVTNVPSDGPISPTPSSEALSKPLLLPMELVWSPVNIFDDHELFKVYELLRDHYVEDNDEHFRFHYQIDFLKWALRVPDAQDSWYLAVRRPSDGEMVGFIAASSVNLCIREKYYITTYLLILMQI
jgi:hypothetical protein